mmetsp:Transcript_20845/g.29982  ORF Transcript_20845/g.29982 Transcript_20845/m.29982 type:complete len:217 (+) Transcript_20845:1185-1835(+)
MRKLSLKLFLIICETLHNIQKNTVDSETDITRKHHNSRSIGMFAGIRPPLIMASRTNHGLPLVLQQIHKESIVPPRWLSCPRSFKPTCIRIITLTCATIAWPRILWILCRRGTSAIRAGSMSLSEGMSPPDKCHGLSVVHTHSSKCISHLRCRPFRHRSTLWSLWVHVYKTYCRCAQRLLAITRYLTRVILLLLRSGTKRQRRTSVRIITTTSTKA